jgi:glycosyltransferase involved in cell wall biosynthesis
MPRSLPSVTVVVTAYNHERFVAEAIDSALRQDYPAELVDVVVVNDGSADGTRAVLDARYGAEPRVRLIHQENRGFVGAVNRGLEEVRGELVALLDADDTWPLDRLRRLANVLA